MSTFRRFEEIKARQAARLLTRSIYRVTDEQPIKKDFALRDQLRRASISIMSNIAEGFERDSNREFHHFLSIAKGSCGELRAQLYVAMDVGYLTPELHNDLHEQAATVSRMISGLMTYLRRSGRRGIKYD